MSPLDVGTPAAAIEGLGFGDGPVGLFFFKVTCPTCQLAAPTMHRFESAYPGRVVGIGQDPEGELARFSMEYDVGIRTIEDAPPYLISDAYEIVSVPTLYVIGADGLVSASVGAWDRDGFNAAAATLAEGLGAEPVLISMPDDGRPQFKPG